MSTRSIRCVLMCWGWRALWTGADRTTHSVWTSAGTATQRCCHWQQTLHWCCHQQKTCES